MLANRRHGCLRSEDDYFSDLRLLNRIHGGRAEIALDTSPANVREALNNLWSEHVGLRDRVLNELGEVRPHVNVFVNSQTVPRDKVLQTEIAGDAEVCIMPAVSGGESRDGLG